MRVIWITVAAFLMVFQDGHTVGAHEHVHYELPEWETLNEAIVRTSGDTSTGLPTYYWKGG